MLSCNCGSSSYLISSVQNHGPARLHSNYGVPKSHAQQVDRLTMERLPAEHLRRIAEFASVSNDEVSRFESLILQLGAMLSTYQTQLDSRSDVLQELRSFLVAVDQFQVRVRAGRDDNALIAAEERLHDSQPLRDDISSRMIAQHLAIFSTMSQGSDLWTSMTRAHLSLISHQTQSYIISHAARSANDIEAREQLRIIRRSAFRRMRFKFEAASSVFSVNTALRALWRELYAQVIQPRVRLIQPEVRAALFTDPHEDSP